MCSVSVGHVTMSATRVQCHVFLLLGYTRVDPEPHASPSKLMEDAYDLEKSGTYLAESGLLPHLLTAMHQLSFASANNTAKQFGERTKGEL